MAQTKPPVDKSQVQQLSACDKIRLEIDNKSKQIARFQSILENLLNDYGSEGDVETILKHRENITALNKELQNLKAEKRKLNCPDESSISFSSDNQSLLSTSSVRRKDGAALVRSTDTRQPLLQ